MIDRSPLVSVFACFSVWGGHAVIILTFLYCIRVARLDFLGGILARFEHLYYIIIILNTPGNDKCEGK